MKLDCFVKLALSMIVVLLGTLVFRPFFQPVPVEAQSVDGRSFYVEPGYTMLRKPDGSGQMYGKMMIDMRTGDIWGFPTLVEGPYPVDPGKSEPPHSRPIYLGKFVLSDAHR
ncbi:MAG TPA: hypothetical protein VF772_14155 [Terriglobales bacterium]